MYSLPVPCEMMKPVFAVSLAMLTASMATVMTYPKQGNEEKAQQETCKLWHQSNEGMLRLRRTGRDMKFRRLDL